MCNLVDEDYHNEYLNYFISDCKGSEWKCLERGGCIRRTELCDGEMDCLDMSDEMNCRK